MEKFVGHGDILNKNGEQYVIGSGCYLDADLNDSIDTSPKIRSSVYGNINIIAATDNQKHDIIYVIPIKTTEPIIKAGDLVYCKVQKILSNQVIVEMLTVGDRLLASSACPKGIIKREDILLNTIDATAFIHDYFRPRDILRAEVISLGDMRQYYLKTSSDDLGVIKAPSQYGDGYLIPINSKEMQDPIAKTIERRKVADVK